MKYVVLEDIMAQKLTPLQKVKADFESKEALVKILAEKLERFDGENGDDFTDRLMRVSNSKLLRLHGVVARFEEEFSGDKAALVDALVQYSSARQANDKPYKTKLLSMRLTRLLDMHDSAKKRASR